MNTTKETSAKRQEKAYCGFEQGPIRPPSEANSLLIRVSRNCPWNKCTFCSLYKGTTFSMRPVEHVIRDIDSIRYYVDHIMSEQRAGRRVNQSELMALSPKDGTPDLPALYAASSFVASGMQSIFIQDGNSLILKPDSIIRILRHLQTAFPLVQRVTSYARSQTIAKIADEHLQQMADAGLNRIHIGMESGSDTVLERVKKGVDKATHVRAGLKVKKAGIQLSEYFMPGLGGKSLSEENAIETADALNQINPDFIRLRTLALPPDAPLTEEYNNGDFDKMGEVDTARELLTWLENLEGITSAVRSDHVLNLFPEIDGTLPDDKKSMMEPLQNFLKLEPYDQMLFCIGRRTHRLHSLEDLQDPIKRGYIVDISSQLGATTDNFDDVIDTLMKRFI